MTAQDRNTYARAWRVKNAEKVLAYKRAYRAANGEKIRAQERARGPRIRPPEYFAQRRVYRASNRDAANERAKKWYRANTARALANSRKSAGLPEPTRPCPSVCECCKKPPGKRALAIDHCHDTGAFRGWLCTNCNTGLGKFGDSITELLRAIGYLQRTGSNP